MSGMDKEQMIQWILEKYDNADDWQSPNRIYNILHSSARKRERRTVILRSSNFVIYWGNDAVKNRFGAIALQ